MPQIEIPDAVFQHIEHGLHGLSHSRAALA